MLRFVPERENTDSIKSKPLQVSGTADPSLSSMADLTHGNTTMLQPSAMGKPDWAAQPAVESVEKPAAAPARSATHEVDFAHDSAGVIDFDALLSDAVQAVQKAPTSQKASPFGRMSAPRTSSVISEEAIFAPGSRPAPAALKISAEAPDADSLFESGSPSLFHDPQFASAATHGEDDNVVQRPRIELPRRALPAKSQLVRKIVQGLITAALAIGILGVGSEFVGFGYFGSKFWLNRKTVVKAKVKALSLAELKVPVALLDTRESYEAEIRRLEQLANGHGNDPQLQQALADRYLDLLERYPTQFREVVQYHKRLTQLLATLKKPARLAALEMLADANLVGAVKQLATLDAGSFDDQGVAVRIRLADVEQQLMTDALTNPGLTSAPDVDPLRKKLEHSVELDKAAAQMNAMREAVQTAANATKFTMLDAVLQDRLGAFDKVVTLLEPLVAKAESHTEAWLVLGTAQIERSEMARATAQLAEAHRLATEQKSRLFAKRALMMDARLAAKKGEPSKMISILQEALALTPTDELTTIRLGRLLMLHKRSEEAKALLVGAKKKLNFQSIAFEVALVEYWLNVNRNEDALEEIKEATKFYPDSVDLLYLRGQVEDKESHFATARDTFAQVIQREPRHLRAIMRLAELQAVAGKHDEALTTLVNARKILGDDEEILRLTSEELLALRRDVEGRAVLTILLRLSPQNRTYLLRAAKMDLHSGEVDRALGFLRQLRANKALDREAAMQLAQALASKNQPDEAAATVLPFAESAPSDVELNTLTGTYLIDSKDYDRAQTVLDRAAETANGKSPDTLYQFGRLAFRRGEIEQGIARIRQAIGLDGLAWWYRMELARNLFDEKSRKGARETAVVELNTILSGEANYATARRPVTAIADVHRMLARSFIDQLRYAQAVPHLRAVLEKEPNDADTLVMLGHALYATGSKDAQPVLRDVLRMRPSDARAALYLGLTSLNAGQTSDALKWLQQAVANGGEDVAEAWFHMALIYKERDQGPAAKRAIEQFLKLAPKNHEFRKDAEGIRRVLSGNH